MRNREVAAVLYEIADLLEMREVDFKPRAYRTAAQNIESLGTDVEELHQQGKLEDIPGVGKGIAKKIAEFLETGRVKKLEDLKRDMPVDLPGLSAVEGLGPKRIEKLYRELGITTLDDLEEAARRGAIQDIEGFGENTQQAILENLAFARRSRDRYLLGYVQPEAQEIVEALKPHVEAIEVAGSLRRKKETIGDVDILVVASEPARAMEAFTGMDRVEKVLMQGDTKSSVRLYGGIQVDVRAVDRDSFGSALQYFTGSKEHNIEVRKIALRHDYKLNEYGLFHGEQKLAGTTEEEVYEALGMQWIPPELRENRGEVQAALDGALPDLVQDEDVRGDLQMHTTWSDGNHSVAEMVEEAVALGHEFIAITDHVGSLKVAGGLDQKDLEEQGEEIAAVREEHPEIHIFHGLEANVMKDGSLDVGEGVLDMVDVVLASVHSAFRMDQKSMTERVIRAIEHPRVNILAHPTCRIIQKREPIQLDVERVLEASRENQVVMEINAFPERLDLNDVHVKMAVERGVKLSIGTDAHRRDHLRYYRLGIAVARRGWAEADDVINTYSVQQLQKLFGA
ncbi:MAG TPA: DNA polymerase/3'-5' exonuclease PolX [Thermoplasmatales archaeon]|nr:DNA polymerase/3'-5' exonuclease PolX [Thermoplasmatales archaeon]